MELAIDVAVVLVGSLGAAYCLAVLADRLPAGERVFEPALARPVTTERRPAQLVRLERIVGWSAASATDVHTRLRPVLVEIADARLARRGLRLDRDTSEAERLLGPAWPLVRPDREPPAPGTPALAPAELERILDALEAV